MWGCEHPKPPQRLQGGSRSGVAGHCELPDMGLNLGRLQRSAYSSSVLSILPRLVYLFTCCCLLCVLICAVPSQYTGQYTGQRHCAGLGSLLLPCGSWGSNSGHSLGNKHLYLLGHLTSLWSSYLYR